MRRKKGLAVAVPSSLVFDTPHLREKTVRVGLLARAAAIFRVDEILIYPPSPTANRREAEFLEKILLYLETPQYLKRRMFPLSPEMRYVGVLPPLRTPHHPLGKEDRAAPITYREGLVLRSDESTTFIDIGRAKPVKVMRGDLLPRSRVTLKIERSIEGERLSIVSREDVPFYWGYKVSLSENALGKTIRQRLNELAIVTSRYGKPILEELPNLRRKLSSASRLVVVFGSPREGVGEILARERLKPQDISDLVLNTIPLQGTETVRTEEAIYATLAILNLVDAEVEKNFNLC